MINKKLAAAFLSAMILAPVLSFGEAFGQKSNGTENVIIDAQRRPLDTTLGVVVDDDSRCPSTDFQTIQAAVNAVGAGAVIQVCPGTYQEQVTINKRLTIYGVEYQNENQAIIKPAPAAANSTSLFSGAPVAAIVLVNQASNVVLDGLTVDGATNGISGCSGASIVGVFFRNASGRAENLAIKNIRAVGNGSCQNNFGIFAQSGSGGSSRVEVVNSSIHDYEKAGIVANEVGTQLVASGNFVSGLGSINTNVQNGIQVGFGAAGDVSDNTVINHIFSGCTTPQGCVSGAAGGIIFPESNNGRIVSNTVGKSQAGIFVIGNRAEIRANSVTDTDALDSISIIGNRNEIRANRIFNSDRAGFFVSGNQNEFRNNAVNEAATGILQDDAASSGNVFANNNRFFNTARILTNGASLRSVEPGGNSTPSGISAVRP